MSETQQQKAKPKEIVLISHWFGHIPFFMDCVVPLFLDQGYTIYHLSDKPDDAALFFERSLGKRVGRLHHLQIEQILGVSKKTEDSRMDEVLSHWRGIKVSLPTI